MYRLFRRPTRMLLILWFFRLCIDAVFALPFASVGVEPVERQQPNAFLVAVKTERHVRRPAVPQQVHGWRVRVFRLPTTFRAVRRTDQYRVVISTGISAVHVFRRFETIANNKIP